MLDPSIILRQSTPQEVHLVGIGIGHSTTPVTHNFLAKSLNIPWRIFATECPTVEDAVRIFRSPNQAGGIVTMPWKGEIMKSLDYLGDAVRILRACNVVYFDAEGRLCGDNTDWIGIEKALRDADGDGRNGKKSETAMVVGAGGAARAAVYALTHRFGARTIYMLNRDDGEVAQLVSDCQQMGCSIIHVKTLDQAQGLDPPSQIVGSVPDFEPSTAEEKAVKAILDYFLTAADEKGVILDMCYHPEPLTRNLRLAEAHGWKTVQGTQVVGHQVEALWRFWIPEARLKAADWDGMWEMLGQAVKLDSAGRQALNAQIIESHFGSV